MSDTNTNSMESNLMQLMEITSLDKSTAQNVLRINNNNLEQAINYHLENTNHDYIMIHDDEDGGNDIFPTDVVTAITASAAIGAASPTTTAAASSSNNHHNRHNHHINNSASFSSSSAATAIAGTSSGTPSGINLKSNEIYNSDDNVRPPIPSRREQLLLPEEDNFRFRKRRAPAFTICPLRNFAREAELQEQQLLAAAGDSNIIAGDINAAISSDYPTSAGLITNSGLMAISAISNGSDSDGSRDASSNNDGNDGGINENGGSRRRFNHLFATQTKRPRLEDLFRPPTDLLFWGTFKSARDYATSLNRWLIVNLQDNSEFKSQILNRDIWQDPKLKELILKYFIFWQISVDNPEGLRFKTFYHVHSMPYVCVIDPRTGENKVECKVVTPQQFLFDLKEFLNENSFTLEPIKAVQSSSNSTSSTSVNNKSASLSVLSPQNITFKASELSEEDQLELAIKNSLMETHWNDTNKHNCSGGSDSCNDDNDTSATTQSENDNNLDSTIKNVKNTSNSSINFVKGETSCNNSNKEVASSVTPTKDDITASVSDSYEQYLGNETDPITKIQLRLPDGKRDQLEWPSSTKLRALHLYIQSKYPDIAKEPFKVILSFPRQNILELDDMLSLKDANLHPSVILHLHPDD